uniref:RNA-binding protein MEX3B n=1 Tax=Bactrocera latifrons TaxID=174628 RepID=A0A0K8V5A1_BACLA
MAATQANLKVLSPNVCSSNLLSIKATSISSTTTMMPAPISTNINILSTPSRASSQLAFNSLVSVERSQQHDADGDQRTLQLAWELSVGRVNESATERPSLSSLNNREKSNNAINQHELAHQPIANSQHEQLNQKVDIDTNKSIQPTVSAVTANGFSQININGLTSRNSSTSFTNISMPTLLLPPTIEDRSKRSQNMTECVPVPSSEHVAEIVGRQGCKIKALRAKTNTYIKTPVRGEEPVFVVTGRKEDVAKAKREILSAAEHFSLIRATRKPIIDNSCEAINDSVDGNNCGSIDFRKVPTGPQSIPGQVTKQVRVPYRVVGLVVGPKGATIKHIQHQTQTYIVTPSRDKEPIFEVTGLPDNVESARKQIEAHIALRTGTLSTCGGNNNSSVILSGSTNDVLAVHSLNLLSQILNDPSIESDLLVSLYKADRMRNTLECEEEIGAKVSETPYTNKINFNVNCLENNSIDKQSYMKLLQTDNIQFQNFSWTHQIPDYINYSTNNANLKKASESNILTDVDISHQSSLQKQHNMFTSSQSISSVNNQLQSSQKNQPMLFGNLGCYIQTINIANNSTASNNTSKSGFTHIKYSNSNTQNTSVLTGMARSCSSASSTASSKSANNSGCGSSSRPELINIWKSLGDSLDKDEGIGDSPNIWTLPQPLSTLTGSHCSPSTSISPTDSLLGDISTQTHLNNIGMNNIINESHHETDNIKNVLQQPQFKRKDAIECPVNNSANQRRDCLICKSKKITAVLVPCGHNMFCMECANCICELGDAVCPVCSLNVYHAMRILA